jgi:hypothetical protein
MFTRIRLGFRRLLESPKRDPRQISYEELSRDIGLAFRSKNKKHYEYLESKYTANYLKKMDQHQLLQMVSLLAQSMVKKNQSSLNAENDFQVTTMMYRVLNHVQNPDDTVVVCDCGISLPLAQYIMLAKCATLKKVIFLRWPEMNEHFDYESRCSPDPPPAYSLER